MRRTTSRHEDALDERPGLLFADLDPRQSDSTEAFISSQIEPQAPHGMGCTPSSPTASVGRTARAGGTLIATNLFARWSCKWVLGLRRRRRLTIEFVASLLGTTLQFPL
jgi:hypothetical protein